eukprot:TRINITY_DN5921_c0_g1_i1.p1 TRINITY_DN5921_c0_g1~~TRINITY_DN5921_c0_g1_i1.p1  ORF type:complete len:302 (+),score=70.25 TRINITY_DN5921_c0_g1_i1:180-1085(+)
MGALQTVEADYDINQRDQHKGSGTFGEVRPCTNRTTLQRQAIKSIEKLDWAHRSKVLEEVRLLKLVKGKHENIVNFIELYDEWSYFHLIFEYCSRGSLEAKLSSGDAKLRSGPGGASAVRQLLSALAFLREVCIVHRDIKPENLVYVDDDTLRLVDFGVAVEFPEGSEPLKDVTGSPAFFAPEQCVSRGNKGYGFPVDVWAAGCTVYMTLFAGVHPFLSEQGAMKRAAQLKGEFDVGWTTSSAATSLLEWLLLPHPKDRITPEQALRHPWLASFGLGPGDFTQERPKKLVPNSHGNWVCIE